MADPAKEVETITTAPPKKLSVAKLYKVGWRRVSTRQWVRNFRDYAARFYTLPYRLYCKSYFWTSGYYPDLVGQEYERYMLMFPETTRRMSDGSDQIYYNGATDTDMSAIYSTTDMSSTSIGGVSGADGYGGSGRDVLLLNLLLRKAVITPEQFEKIMRGQVDLFDVLRQLYGQQLDLTDDTDRDALLVQVLRYKKVITPEVNDAFFREQISLNEILRDLLGAEGYGDEGYGAGGGRDVFLLNNLLKKNVITQENFDKIIRGQADLYNVLGQNYEKLIDITDCYGNGKEARGGYGVEGGAAGGGAGSRNDGYRADLLTALLKKDVITKDIFDKVSRGDLDLFKVLRENYGKYQDINNVTDPDLQIVKVLLHKKLITPEILEAFTKGEISLNEILAQLFGAGGAGGGKGGKDGKGAGGAGGGKGGKGGGGAGKGGYREDVLNALFKKDVISSDIFDKISRREADLFKVLRENYGKYQDINNVTDPDLQIVKVLLHKNLITKDILDAFTRGELSLQQILHKIFESDDNGAGGGKAAGGAGGAGGFGANANDDYVTNRDALIVKALLHQKAITPETYEAFMKGQLTLKQILRQLAGGAGAGAGGFGANVYRGGNAGKGAGGVGKGARGAGKDGKGGKGAGGAQGAGGGKDGKGFKGAGGAGGGGGAIGLEANANDDEYEYDYEDDGKGGKVRKIRMFKGAPVRKSFSASAARELGEVPDKEIKISAWKKKEKVEKEKEEEWKPKRVSKDPGIYHTKKSFEMAANIRGSLGKDPLPMVMALPDKKKKKSGTVEATEASGTDTTASEKDKGKNEKKKGK